jgi:hypothetical protein
LTDAPTPAQGGQSVSGDIGVMSYRLGSRLMTNHAAGDF